jgi:hypothetical protein
MISAVNPINEDGASLVKASEILGREVFGRPNVEVLYPSLFRLIQ